MPRLLVDATWFPPIEHYARWHAEVVQGLTSSAELLFPDYHLIPFPVVASDQSQHREPWDDSDELKEWEASPDFALLERRFREWWLLLITPDQFPLETRILPDVVALSGARYGLAEVEQLSAEAPALANDLLRTMVTTVQPRVTVITNRPHPEWRSTLDKYHAIVMVAELFKSAAGVRAIHLDRDYQPLPTENVVAICHSDDFMGLLALETPHRLPPTLTGGYTIEYDGSSTIWEVCTTDRNSWLIPKGDQQIPSSVTLHIIRTEGGRLLFRSQPAL